MTTVLPPPEHVTVSLGALLSLTSGYLVCELADMYAAQDAIAGRPLMTHERVGPEERRVREHILNVLPRLAEADPPPEFPVGEDGTKREACQAWVQSIAGYLGWDTAVIVKAPAA